MDRGKVIKGLHDIGGFIAGRIGIEQARNFLRVIDDALELLKDQEAVEPLPQNSNGWIRTIKLWYCGACHSKISRRTSKYCPNCGKPIQWEGEKTNE